MSEIALSFDRLFWRTRGKSWDYRIVLTPREQAIKDWFAVSQKVANEFTDRRSGCAAGELVDGQMRVGFIASAFRDESSVDYWGRTVFHSFIYTVDACDSGKLLRWPSDWAEQCLARLRVIQSPEAFDQTDGFKQTPVLVRGRSVKLHESLNTVCDQCSVLSTIFLSEDRAAANVADVIRDRKDFIPEPGSKNTYDLGECLLRGEVNALYGPIGGFRKPIRLVIPKHQDDEVRTKIARSFHAGKTDQFTDVRFEGVRKRVMDVGIGPDNVDLRNWKKSDFGSESGYDLLVKWFCNHFAGQSVQIEDLTLRIADSLSADPGDHVVTNVAYRVHELLS